MKWRLEASAIWLVLMTLIATFALPASAQRRRPNRPHVDLPRGAVRQVILRSCTSCHGIDDYAYHAMDRAGWQALIETMKQKGAVLSDDDRSILLDWLVAKFGPDSKPFQPTQGPPPTLADGAARRLLENSCTTCHTLERVDAARFTQEKWQTIVVEMKNKGARLADEDVATLVEYFTRTHGPTN